MSLIGSAVQREIADAERRGARGASARIRRELLERIDGLTVYHYDCPFIEANALRSALNRIIPE